MKPMFLLLFISLNFFSHGQKKPEIILQVRTPAILMATTTEKKEIIITYSRRHNKYILNNADSKKFPDESYEVVQGKWTFYKSFEYTEPTLYVQLEYIIGYTKNDELVEQVLKRDIFYNVGMESVSSVGDIENGTTLKMSGGAIWTILYDKNGVEKITFLKNSSSIPIRMTSLTLKKLRVLNFNGKWL